MNKIENSIRKLAHFKCICLINSVMSVIVIENSMK